MSKWMIHTGSALAVLRQMPSERFHTCVTSPPYWGLRDYGEEGQIGLEKTPEEYVERIVEVFSEVHRVLRDDGTLWLNLGDSYSRVLDPFSGAGTTVMVARRLGRYAEGIELKPEYVEMSRKRIYEDAPLLNGGGS